MNTEVIMSNDPLDCFINEMQDTVDSQTMEDFGPEIYNRWKDPVHAAQILAPDSQAELTGSCGDKMSISLSVERDIIRQAAFFTTGCGHSQVCADLACELAEGKTLNQALNIEGADILKILLNIPDDNEHCAFLAAETLHLAIKKYIKLKNMD